MRSLMPKRYEPAIWAWPSTPDGFAEVTVEVGGRILATQVACPGMSHDEFCAMREQLMDALRRSC